ncbi:hypothetical protein V2W45_1509518, partial [Cenococcum geophilum]
MRLLEILPNGDFRLTKELPDNAIPRYPYAILSHTWGTESEEVTFEEIGEGSGRVKAGYRKIQFCGDQAVRDGLRYFWVDSCCIKKSSDAELSESLNSMFRWYQRAEKCYVYLSDVSIRKRKRGDNNIQNTWEQAFRRSRWFTRGWTLQELLAPSSVEFFSKGGSRFGDKQSLEQQIHEITDIPILALRGSALSQFSTEQKFGWAKNRKTTREEDWAYSLLGIFEISMPVVYGEGRRNAVRRLEKEIDDASKAKQCLRDLRVTDPRADKVRIEETKGGLLVDSYQWILEDGDFKQWRNDQQSHLLWIKGDPGKGKTMLLCGIINELKKSIAKTHLLSFFYCQATDSRINSATAVLRGLLYLLIDQQPSLISHIQKQHDLAGKTLFEDTNAWVSLSDIFTNVLQDPSLESAYLIIDALDECVAADLPKLLDFIVKKSPVSPRVKWIVSSRNWPSIEKKLNTAAQGVWLCLELNENSVSTAVTSYIQFKVNQLARGNAYDNETCDAVQQYLLLNANGTFLWVALVCQELADISGWDAEELSKAFPPELDLLYKRMLDEICNSKHAKLCKSILAVVSVVRRPIMLGELESFVDMPARSSGNYKILAEIIGLCGSFLTLQECTISFVHQSAKDFLVGKAYNEIYSSGIEYLHHTIFSRSLQIMSKKLKRDVYGLGAPGVPIDQVKQPDSDPLSLARYSCVYWIDHLLDCNPTRNATNDLQDGGSVDKFLRRSYLYWLEALSLCRSMSEGVVSMAKLEALLQVRAGASGLLELVQDARRFIMYHKQAIQISPLQAYASALIFSPASSLIRRHFKKEEPEWITIKPNIGDKWSACLQTLEGHSGSINSVAFSRDSTRLASASDDRTVKIWDASSGECLQTLEGHSESIHSVAFSHDSIWLASASDDRTIRIWNAGSGECLQTLGGHSNSVRSVAFSHDSTRLASASGDGTIRIWNASSGE